MEKLRRPLKISAPRIVRWKSEPKDRDYYGFKPAPGSVNIFWASAESNVIPRLEAAYLKRDRKALESLSEETVSAWKRRKMHSIREAAKLAHGAPVLFDLRYGGKTLAESLWTPDDGCGTMTLPYTGGDLDDKKFVVASRLTAASDIKIPEILILIAAPVLSKIEQQALQAIPGDLSEVFLGDSPVACTALVVVVVWVAAVTIVTTCCLPFFDKLEQVELSEGTLKKLGAMPSVASLLEIRATIFEEFNVR